MPPKTYKCAVCGEEVSRRKSYAVDGGRACRKHEKAQKAFEEREAQKAKQADKKKEEDARRQNRYNHGMDYDPDEQHKFIQHHCWVCGREGITMRNYYEMLLVGIAREKLRGECNILTEPRKTWKLAGLDKNVLVVIPYEYDKNIQVKPRVRTLALFANQINMCQECARQNAKDFQARVKELTTPKKEISLETLHMIGSIYEGSNHDKAVKRIAQEMENQEGSDEDYS